MVDVYEVAHSIVAAIHGKGRLPIPGKVSRCVSVINSGTLEWLNEVEGTPFRISVDGQYMEWPKSGRSLPIARFLDHNQATLYFCPWTPEAARRKVRRRELVG